MTDDLGAAILPVPPPARPFTGDASLLVGTYRGPGRGRDMVIEVTKTPQGIAFAVDGAAATPLPWVEGWTFRQPKSPSALLIFRMSASDGPATLREPQGRPEQSRGATELRFDRGGGYFILKRQ